MIARGVRPVAVVAVAVLLALLLAPTAGASTLADRLELPPPPGPEPVTAPTPAPSSPLITQLARLQDFRQTRPRGTVGLAVIDDDGATLASRRDDRPLLPASTVKLVTAAAALRILGPDHRFVTRVYATRAPDARGVVDGDLIIVGGGDPVLATPTYRRKVNMTRPATPLRRLASRIADSGVARVLGRVRGDPSILADQPLATGWKRAYLPSLDTTRSSGLTVDAGLRLFRRSGQLRGAAAADPARRTAHQLDRLLADLDVAVAGPPGSASGLPAGVIEVARIASPPLTDLLAHMLRFSDNQLADGIFRMLGAATGDRTWRGAEAAARAALSDVAVDRRALRLADGSGLSRRDRVTANAMVRLLKVMADGPLRARWLKLLPVAGRTGTMAGRLTGTQAVGRVHAKTGTLRDVRALAATVPGRNGRDHHIAVLANDLPSDRSVTAARRLADVITLSVVAAKDGCRGPIRPPGDAARRGSPERLICGARSGTEKTAGDAAEGSFVGITCGWFACANSDKYVSTQAQLQTFAPDRGGLADGRRSITATVNPTTPPPAAAAAFG